MLAPNKGGCMHLRVLNFIFSCKGFIVVFGIGGTIQFGHLFLHIVTHTNL
jgi:hypothetical protein